MPLIGFSNLDGCLAQMKSGRGNELGGIRNPSKLSLNCDSQWLWKTLVSGLFMGRLAVRLSYLYFW